MSRTALARAYRPRRFSEVATQEHVSATLRSAVQRDRVAHAYLFCGPRGVGKTTLARMLAMALNCPERTAEGEPCGECDSCQRIWAGRTSLDVIEIDAASNRGVDDARDLRERAMYAPSEHDRFKVYIIDEAHMLTREAWNALLKVLEEPPPRVIFVFATTEPQKIQQAAPPILSRCQRFDFHRIGTADLVARMRTVLQAEGVDADDGVLMPIAQKADGGMRDALSLLDQVLSFTEGAPTADDVRRVLGLVGDEIYLELMDIVAERRHAEVFRFVGGLLADGYDLAEFYRGLADFLRALLIVSLDGSEAAQVRDDLRERYEQTAAGFAPGDLLRMLSQVAELDADGRFRKSGQQRILIELLLLRFAYLDRTVEIEDVLAALGGAPAAEAPDRGRPPNPRRGPPAAADEPATPATPGAAGADQRTSSRRPSSGQDGPPAAGPDRGVSESRSRSAEMSADRPDAPGRSEQPSEAKGQSAEASPGGETPRHAAGAAPAPGAGGQARQPARTLPDWNGSGVTAETRPSVHEATSSVHEATSNGGGAGGETAPQGPRASAEGSGANTGESAAPARGAEAEPLEIVGVRRAWRGVLETGAGIPAGMGLLLRDAQVAVAGDAAVRIGVSPGSPLLERLAEPGSRRPLEAALSERLGRKVGVQIAAISGGGASDEPVRRITAENAREDRLRRLSAEEPRLSAAVQEWDLELIE